MEPITVGLLVTWGLSLVLVFGFSLISFLFFSPEPIPDPATATEKADAEEALAERQVNQELAVNQRNNLVLATTGESCFLVGDQPAGTTWLTESLDASVGHGLYFGTYYTVSEKSKDDYGYFMLINEYPILPTSLEGQIDFGDVRPGEVLYVNCLQYGLQIVGYNSFNIYYYLAFGDGTGTDEDEGESNIKLLKTIDDKNELSSDGNNFYLPQGYVYKITYIGLQYRGDSDQYRQTFAVNTALGDNPS